VLKEFFLIGTPQEVVDHGGLAANAPFFRILRALRKL
jgi:hypothetical protein